jgi:hypothetical protein
MRGVLFSLALAAAIAVAAPRTASASFDSATTMTMGAASDGWQQAQPPKDINVDINVNRGGGRWYANPIWIAIGAIAAVVVLLLIVLIARSGGGGTTIVHD